MIFVSVARRCAFILSAATVLIASHPFVAPTQTASLAQTQTPSAPPAETEAFDAAKSLGTKDAWEAFLTHYPTGFRADLARAYIKQLSGSAPPAASTPAASNAPPPPFIPQPSPTTQPVAEQAAIEQSCDTQRSTRPLDSTVPVKIRFDNQSGGHIVLQRIDANGRIQEAGTLDPGASVTHDTFLTHPWIAAYGEGSCRQLFLPAGPFSVARLVPESALPKKSSAPAAKPQAKPKAPPPPLRCAANYRLIRGECVLQQNCGPNATRTPEGDCFCNRGFQFMNGQCSRPQQRANQCSRHEVYSSSMGQCIPKAAMCGPNEVYSSSLAACIPR